MPKQESLITAVLFDGKGGGRKVGWDEVEQWTPAQGVLWVHLNYKSSRSLKWLKKESGLDEIIVRSMSRDETRPRSVVSSKGLSVFLRGVNLNPGEDPEDMVSIRVWIDEQRIITTRKRKLLSIDDLRAALDEGHGPRTPAEFLRMLNDRLIDRMADVIEDIDARVDGLEEDVLTTESHLLRPKIAAIRRQSIMIRRYLSPQREALSRLYLEEVSFLSQIDRVYIREATDRIVRYIEDLDTARDRAAIIQEELTSRLSEHMEKRMYLLSVVAVIFLPVTFIAGLLGINVGGIPGAEHKLAFWFVCAVLLLIMLVMLFFFRRKKWM